MCSYVQEYRRRRRKKMEIPATSLLVFRIVSWPCGFALGEEWLRR